MSNRIKGTGSESFKGRFGALMSMIGMCLGLGSVWRFPYMVGAYGGGAFVVAYLVCIILIVVPIATVEAGIGKGIGKGIMEVYEAAIKNKVISKIMGGICAFIYGSLNFFFIPIIATCIYFIYACAKSMWKTVPAEDIYDISLSNHGLMLAITILITLFVGYIVYRGVDSGIEKISNIMIPLMFFFFAGVIIFEIFAIDGIGEGYDFYLNPDWSMLAKPSLWVAAMGQALFAIGVGPGCVLTYGSHLPKNEDVNLNMATVCISCASLGVIVGMAIIPPCIALGLNPESGAKLIFVVLPALFEILPFGNIIGILIFFAIFFAAITTAIAQLEVPVSTFMNGFKLPRGKTAIVATAITMVAACLAIYSDTFLNFFSDFAGNYGFTLTAGIGSIVYGWVYGVDKIRKEYLNPTSDIVYGRWFAVWTKYVAIPILILVMLNSLFPIMG